MNPENQNLYSISDLADQVGVPRTTITDWLGKYARFIELQTQGRRRFYTDRTLSVLCKVAELRTAGRSIGDIDGELERIFPVHPTVEPPNAADGTGTASSVNSAGPDAMPPNQDSQSYPVVKQENFDELYDLLGAKFTDLCDAMNAVNKKADASARRLRVMLAVAVMIIVVLAGFLALFYVFFLVQRDNTAASRDAAATIAAFTAGSETRENALRTDVGNLSGNVSGIAGTVSGLEGSMSGIAGTVSGLESSVSGIAGTVSGLEGSMSGLAGSVSGMEGSVTNLAGSVSGLAGSVSGMEGRVTNLAGSVSGMEGRVSSMNDELQKLRADLPAQRAAFEAAIEEMKRANGSALEAQQAQFEARIALEKEQFAAERLKLLQQIDSLQERLKQSAENEPARDEEIRKLREELAAQTERVKDVEKLNGNIDILSGRIEDLKEKNQTLSKDLAAAKQRADAEAEARKKAEEEAEKARRAAASAPAQYNPFPRSGGNP